MLLLFIYIFASINGHVATSSIVASFINTLFGMSFLHFNPYPFCQFTFFFNNCFATLFIMILHSKIWGLCWSPSCLSFTFTFVTSVSDGVVIIVQFLALLQASLTPYSKWVPPLVICTCFHYGLAFFKISQLSMICGRCNTFFFSTNHNFQG